jgi:hypothetical protein
MICPNLRCGGTVIAPDAARGKVVRCVHCHTLFMVPANRSPQPQPAEQEQEKKKEKQKPKRR